MTPVFISEDLKKKVPELVLSCIECNVKVVQDNNALWDEINKTVEERFKSLQVEHIGRMAAIAAARRAYKLCGKDPARYRLSAEALLRRTVQGKGIYQVNNVVDLLNLVSLSTGFSIGGYDAGKIKGEVFFGTGNEDEPYEGIGRGRLNIGNLPVFRDALGAFGSPTSDSVRTSVTLETKRFLMIIIDFGSPELLDHATSLATNLLIKYAGAERIETGIV